MKRITLTLLLIVLGHVIYAQYTGIDINLKSNYLFIPSKSKTSQATPVTSVTGLTIYSSSAGYLEESYNSSVGLDFSIAPSFRLSDKFSINVGLGFLYTNYDRDVEVIYDQDYPTLNFGSGQLFGQLDGDGNLIVTEGGSSQVIGEPRNGETKLGFIAIPIQLDYRLLKKLSINTSINVNQLLFARENGTAYGGYDFQTRQYLLEDVVHKDTDTFKNTQVTIGLGLSYNIWNHLSLTGDFQRSLTNMYQKDNQYVDGIKFNRLSLGLSYRISKTINTK